MAFITQAERNAVADAPWLGAAFSTNGAAAWEGAVRLRAQRLSMRNFPAEEALMKGLARRFGEPRANETRLGETEWILMVDAPPEYFAPALASGRLPVPGKNEVLAGELARVNEFRVKNRTFTVVGRLRRETGALCFAYVLPRHDRFLGIFGDADTVTDGWFDPDFLDRIDNETVGPESLRDQPIHAQPGLALPLHVWGIIAGLFLVALGGAIVQVRLFQGLGQRIGGPLGPVLRAMIDSPFLLAAMHVLLYGTMFIGMTAAASSPVDNLRMITIIQGVFSEGSLDYIGDAFKTGNIPLTAAAIWVNNYLLQTLGLTFAISLAVPFLGVLKNLISFGVAGFGLSPLWIDSSGMFVYHSITMTLELEAYIVACFAVSLVPVRFIGGIRNRAMGSGLVDGLKIAGAGALLTAIMLAIAALYEAATLITLQ